MRLLKLLVSYWIIWIILYIWNPMGADINHIVDYIFNDIVYSLGAIMGYVWYAIGK